MASVRAELARALRNGRRDEVVFLLARMERAPYTLRAPLQAAAVACLLCETYEGAPASAGPFDSYHRRREDALQALFDAAEQTVLRRRPRKVVP